jgi:hypothetical protein
MDALKQSWIDKTQEAILTVEHLLGLPDEWAKTYVKLANWIYSTDINPYQFMPTGCEMSKSSAQDFVSFLNILHHSMIDDGSIMFVETERSSFMILDVEADDHERIKLIVDRRFAGSGSIVPFQVHDDAQRFIDHLEAQERALVERTERHQQRMDAYNAAQGNEP